MAGNLTNFLETQGITPEMWNSYNMAERTGIADSISGLGGLDAATDLYSTDANGIGLGNLGGNWMDTFGGYKGLQAIGGIGQLGLGYLGYLDNKKTAEKQRQLLGQQIDTNQFLLNQARGRQGDIARDFGGGSAPQGLAASTAGRKVL